MYSETKFELQSLPNVIALRIYLYMLIFLYGGDKVAISCLLSNTLNKLCTKWLSLKQEINMHENVLEATHDSQVIVSS